LLLSGSGASLGAILLSLSSAAWASIGSCALIGAMIAVGLAILSMPILLGWLADRVGLRFAHPLVPGLVLGGLALFIASHQLQRRLVRRTDSLAAAK
jgi:hypothetical protein